jgi:integrase
MPRVERLPSGSYRIRYVDPWGRRIPITRSTAADVRAAYKRVLGQMANGTYTDPKLGRVTLEQWADDWLAGARNLSAGGYDTYRRDLDRHILPDLGKILLGKLSATDIDRYLSGKAQPPRNAVLNEVGRTRGLLAPSTIHRHYRTLHRCLAVAVERGLIAKNPCGPVEPPKVPRRARTVLTIEQVDALADAISERYRAWVFVAAYGELRWSETVGLRRGRVDGAVVQVLEQLVHRGSGWDRCEPKAGSKRTVTLPAFAADELKQHLDRFTLPGPDSLVFTTRNGTPPQAPSWTANTFKRALRRAGLPAIRVHDLRHTGISLSIDAGANPKLSQMRAGHSSIGIHYDTYGHLFPAADQAVADRLDSLRAESQRRRLRAV